MTARIIGLAQVKGGAGRSTVATNLAGELARFHDVLLIDCDLPQGTSASWAELRREAVKARDELAKMMTPAQVAEAQKRASAWQPK